MSISLKAVLLFVVWAVALATAKPNKATDSNADVKADVEVVNGDVKADVNAVLQRTKELAEESEATELAAMRSREEAEEKEELKKIRLREENGEQMLSSETRRDEVTAERNLKETQEGKSGQNNLVDLMARQELRLAAMQRQIEEHDAESQKTQRQIYQRFEETEQELKETRKELKETKHRLQLTQKRVKQNQNHWKTTVQTISSVAGHRQNDQESTKVENSTDETSNTTSRQKGIQANSVEPLTSWITATGAKIEALQKKYQQQTASINVLQSTDQQQTASINVLQSTDQQLQTELQTVKASVPHCEAGYKLTSAIHRENFQIKFTSKFTTSPTMIVSPSAAANSFIYNGKAIDFIVQYSNVRTYDFKLYVYTDGTDGKGYVNVYWLACGN